MEPTIATTPFGARSVSLAQIDARRLARRISVVFAGNADPGWSRLPWRRG